MTPTAEQRLQALGLTLPEVAPPRGNFLQARWRTAPRSALVSG
ncbi:hypothetical protein ACVC7V_25845 [Hydrogenophaga sp. A37]